MHAFIQQAFAVPQGEEQFLFREDSNEGDRPHPPPNSHVSSTKLLLRHLFFPPFFLRYFTILPTSRESFYLL